jgi:putative NIF3 family GTP cyclohydrolase 1 type 2
VHDNLDAACQIVENVAKEKALLEVDDALSAQYIARRKHRDVRRLGSLSPSSMLTRVQRSTQPFWDSSAMTAQHYSQVLPDALRIKLGGLQPDQMRVYEDFSRARTGLPVLADQEPLGMKGLIQRQNNVGQVGSSPPEDGKRPPYTVQFAIAQVNVRSCGLLR